MVDGGGPSKSDLAEAGRKKLEAFRNRKRKKKKKKKEKVGGEPPEFQTRAQAATEASELRVDEKGWDENKSLVEKKEDEVLKTRGEVLPPKVEEEDEARWKVGQASTSVVVEQVESQGEEGNSNAKAIVEKSDGLKVDSRAETKSLSLAASYSMLSDSYISSPQGSPKKKDSPSRLLFNTLAGKKEQTTRVPTALKNFEAKAPSGDVGEFKRPDVPKYRVLEDASLLSEQFNKHGLGPSNHSYHSKERHIEGQKREHAQEVTKKDDRLLREEHNNLSVPQRSRDYPVNASSTHQQDDKQEASSSSSKRRDVSPPENNFKSPMTYKGATISEKDVAGFQAHIDLLAREKYELQRGLESQQKAIENLTSENISLTERFNSQGASTSGLKGEIEDLQEQVDSLARAAERALEERDAALNGSAASAERTKSLASEVIQLEERLLQARSNELKADKQRAMAEEKLDGLQSKFKSSVEERDALLGNIVKLKSGEGDANGVHTIGQEGLDRGKEATHHANGFLSKTREPDSENAASRVLGPVTPIIAHSQNELSVLVANLGNTTNYQTVSVVKSIFSLLEDLSS